MLSRMKSVMDDLLSGREPFSASSLEAVGRLIEGQVVLITGMWPVGAEIARQLFSYRPEKLVLFDHSGNELTDAVEPLLKLRTRMEYSGVDPLPEITAVYGEVESYPLLQETLQQHCPDLIIHTAGRMLEGASEYNKIGTIKANLLGTLHTLQAAITEQIPRVVVVGDSRSASPVNLLRQSRWAAEQLALALAAEYKNLLLWPDESVNPSIQGTEILVVRMPVLLDPSMPEIARALQLATQGGRIRLPKGDRLRYRMSITEAVSGLLSEISKSSDHNNGEIVQIDSKAPIDLHQLLTTAASTSNCELEVEWVEDEVVGAVTNVDGDQHGSTSHGRKRISWSAMQAMLKPLMAAVHRYDEEAACSLLRKMVEESR